MTTWYAPHDPFPKTESFFSISTGVMGYNSINCHLAQEKGNKMLKNMKGVFGSLTFKRNYAVKPLSNMSLTMKIKENVVTIDQLSLFQRMLISQPTKEELRDYFQYELGTYPMSLFDEAGMWKGTKSSLFESFDPLEKSNVQFGHNHFNVLDGG